jgi:hypothetical protein
MKKKINKVLTAVPVVLILMLACSKEKVDINSSNSEGIPYAFIKNDAVTFSESVSTVTLDGSLSYDPYGFPITFQWKKLSGPSDPLISNASESIARISNLKKGTYTIQLTITSKSGKVAMDTGYIYIIENKAPVANAGFNQTILYPDQSTTLNAAYSTDYYDAIVKYEWKQISGPSNSVIHSPNASSTVVSIFQFGKYSFELSVFDALNAIGRDTVEITAVGPVIANNEVLFSYQTAVQDGWGHHIEIPDIDRFIPQGDSIKAVFIRPSGTTTWTEFSSDPALLNAYFVFSNNLFIYIDERVFGIHVDVKVKW